MGRVRRNPVPVPPGDVLSNGKTRGVTKRKRSRFVHRHFDSDGIKFQLILYYEMITNGHHSKSDVGEASERWKSWLMLSSRPFFPHSSRRGIVDLETLFVKPRVANVP